MAILNRKNRFRRKSALFLGWAIAVFKVIWRAVVYPYVWSRRVLHASLLQIVEWYDKGSLSRILYGLPALVVLSSSVFLGILAFSQSPVVLSDSYRAVARRAMDEKDWRVAEVCLQRLISMAPTDEKGAFDLALASIEMDELTRANSLLMRLAPIERPVNADAHLWRAQRLLEKRELTREEVVEVEQQLKNVLILTPRNDMARSLLGQVLKQIGKPKEARELLGSITLRSPNDEFLLAELLLQDGDLNQARLHGQEAVRLYRKRHAGDPTNLAIRLELAKALVFIEEFSTAAELLLAADAGPNSAVIRQTLSRVYATWSQSLAPSQGLTEFQFDLIAKSLQFDPQNQLAYDQIIRFLNLPEGADLERLRDLLRTMLAAGHQPSLVHLCMGLDQSFHDNNEGALSHLQIAHQLNPQMAVIANNLAWQIAFSPEGDLEKALKLCEQALAQAPEYPEIRETRGQILVKLGRWAEAVADLESVIAKFSSNVQTRSALIAAYQGLGMQDMADKHSQILRVQQSPENQ